MFNYLLDRPNSYYFRIRIPDDLRERIGKRFIVRSLNTKNRRHASHQASSMGMQLYSAFQQMRQGKRSVVDIDKLAKSLGSGNARELVVKKLTIGNSVAEGVKVDPNNPQDQKMYEQLLAHMAQAANIAATSVVATPAPPVKAGPQYFLKDEIDAYVADCTRRKLDPKTVKTYASLLNVLLSALGNVPVSEITDPDMDRYLDMLQLLPATASQKMAFRNLETVEEIIALNEVLDEPTIGEKVIQQHINRSKAFFEYVIKKRRHLSGINPLEGRDLLSASAMKKSDRQRFENEHLLKIFSAGAYRQHNGACPEFCVNGVWVSGLASVPRT